VPTGSIVAIAVGALILGLVAGYVLRAGLKQAVVAVGAFVTGRAIVILAAGAVMVAGLVLISSEGGSPQLWSQLISLVGLGTVTLLVFVAGPEVYTPRRQFTVGEDEAKHTYTVGMSLTKAEYDALAEPHRNDVVLQRGLFFRGLYTGTDGRWSTSKMQVLLWTYAIVFALLAIFIALQLKGGLKLDQGNDEGTGTDEGTGFADREFDDQYLLLLGGYFAAAVLAKGITTNKVESGETVKEPANPDRA
jgi:hypothetical protein